MEITNTLAVPGAHTEVQEFESYIGLHILASYSSYTLV